jgi:hypothetical protein
MNTLNYSSNIHGVDKDILFYINATEQDQWNEFILEDSF